MDHPCTAIKMPKAITDILILLAQFIISYIFYLHQFVKHHLNYSSDDNHRRDYVEEDNEEGRRPSPLLVPVPFTSHVVSKLIKKNLPVVKFSNFLERSGERGDKDWDVACAICLNWIEESEEIRELSNCSHVFHQECMGGWLDQGHVTCPLCRLMLLPAQADEDVKGGRDPWRLERIAYLFGEDYVLDAL